MKFTPFILFLSILLMFSCKPDPKKGGGNKTKATSAQSKQKAVAGNKRAAKVIQPKNSAATKGNKANATKAMAKKGNNNYYTSLAKSTGVPSVKINKLKEIDDKYRSTINALKKQGKWEGAANSSLRKAQNEKKKVEIKTLLGDALFNKKAAFDKKWKVKK